MYKFFIALLIFVLAFDVMATQEQAGSASTTATWNLIASAKRSATDTRWSTSTWVESPKGMPWIAASRF